MADRLELRVGAECQSTEMDGLLSHFDVMQRLLRMLRDIDFITKIYITCYLESKRHSSLLQSIGDQSVNG